jgi:hypothetical protein
MESLNPYFMPYLAMRMLYSVQVQAPRVSYEDWKFKQKEAEGKLAAVAENEEKNMRESTYVLCGMQ